MRFPFDSNPFTSSNNLNLAQPVYRLGPHIVILLVKSSLEKSVTAHTELVI